MNYAYHFVPKAFMSFFNKKKYQSEDFLGGEYDEMFLKMDSEIS